MSNVFSFTGTVGRDAEVRATPSGQTVLNVTVANNVGFGDRQQTLWVRVALWGKRAEGQLQNYLTKGQQIFVSGELSQNHITAAINLRIVSCNRLLLLHVFLQSAIY